MAPDAILGREQELAALARFFEVEPRTPRALLVEGEAGIGKTTMWREAVRLAAGRGRVLASRASEAEASLSFTVLHDLLEPALVDVLDQLPAAQRRALEAALLIGESRRARPDARAVSLAVLGAVRSLATESPLTIAVDDVQWTDALSARVLAFGLRRLAEANVTVVAAKRVEPRLRDPLNLAATFESGLHRLELGPMPPSALGSLLRRRLEGDFPHPLMKRIHEASGGNPFFAIEIGRALGRDGVRPHPGEPLPVPPDLQGLLLDRLSALSPKARRALLIAASSAAPTIDMMESLSGRPLALEEAERAGFVELDGRRIVFTHPLLASTVYADASSRSRRGVHRLLAGIVTDPEEHARHLALSAAGPDEEVAAALDRGAEHARARGATQAAAELYLLAAEATPLRHVEELRLRRTSAALNLFDAGDTRGARELMEQALAQLDAGQARADTLYSLSIMSWNYVPRVEELLVQALAEVGDDELLRAGIVANLAWVAWERGEVETASARAREALELAERAGDPAVLRLALSILGLAECVLSRPAGDILNRAVSLEGVLTHAETDSASMCLARTLMWAGDLDGARAMLESELDRYREQGYESACWTILVDLARVEYRIGRWNRAAFLADEAHEICVEAGLEGGLGQVLPVRAAVACVTGELDASRHVGTEALAICERTGDRWNEVQARAALGILELSVGDVAAAHERLAPAVAITHRMGLREPGVFPFVPDEVEALVSLGELEEAKALTEELEERGKALSRPLALATAGRCRGLIAAVLGDLPGAAVHLERALAEHDRVGQPFELARTLLAAGGVQRRMKKKASARAFLGRATVTFDELGALLWAEKARAELARVGGRAPSPEALTPTEEQVARLVAEGRTNREVAEALFMSVHTVSANLKRIYRKLNVRSRTELVRKL